MTMLELNDLSPLIQASDYWMADPSRVLWLKTTEGKISIASTEPDVVYAEVRTVSNIADVPTAVEIPTVFVEWPSGKHVMALPVSWETAAPYVGRPYALGTYDCYTLVCDWMLRERGVTMKKLVDTPERLTNQWLSDSVFEINPEIVSWDRVIAPQVGDGILFSMGSRNADNTNLANHCGVYLEGNMFLHHFPNRASCIQAFDQSWKSKVVSYMRYNG